MNIVLREGDCVDNELDFDVTAADGEIADANNAIAIVSIVNIVEFCVADSIITQVLYMYYLTLSSANQPH